VISTALQELVWCQTSEELRVSLKKIVREILIRLGDDGPKRVARRVRQILDDRGSCGDWPYLLNSAITDAVSPYGLVPILVPEKRGVRHHLVQIAGLSYLWMQELGKERK